MARSNVAKYKDFADGEILTADHLDVDLQQNFADEYDQVVRDTVGSGVIGTAVGTVGWTVTEKTPPSLNIDITAGVGYIDGQRVESTATTTINGLPINQSSNQIKVYAFPTVLPIYNTTNNSWEASFAATTGAVPADALEIARVSTNGTEITSVTHTRFILETPALTVSAVDDSVAAADSALSFRERFNHFFSRIREIIDPSGDWDDAITTSLAGFFAKFHNVTGHAHSGSSGDGARIAAANVTFVPAGSIASTNVQSALQEVDNEKLARAGGTMTGPLRLSYTPTQGSHAINLDYLTANVGTGPNYAWGAVASNQALTTTFVQFATVDITTTGGAVYLFPETGLQCLGDFDQDVGRTITIEYRRGVSPATGSAIKTISNGFGNVHGAVTGAGFEVIGYVNIPEHLDDTVIGSGGTYRYTLWLKVDSTTDFTVATSFISGRLNAIEFK